MTKLYDIRDDISSAATSLQHLRMEFSYHDSYVMPKLAVTTQTFCITLGFLRYGLASGTGLCCYKIEVITVQKFYGGHHEVVNRYGVSISAMKIDQFNVSLDCILLISARIVVT